MIRTIEDAHKHGLIDYLPGNVCTREKIWRDKLGYLHIERTPARDGILPKSLRRRLTRLAARRADVPDSRTVRYKFHTPGA